MLPGETPLLIATSRPITDIPVVIFGAALLFVTVSTAVLTVPVITGFVPNVVASGVTGTLSVMTPPGSREVGCTQFTVWPVVMQLQVLLVKVIGALVPTGNVIVAVSGPDVGPVPMFDTVICTVLLMPTTMLGAGWPMTEVRSGGGTPTRVLAPLDV